MVLDVTVTTPNVSSEPFVDENGYITVVWNRYFQDLWTRTGGVSDNIGGVEIGKPSDTGAANAVIYFNASKETSQDTGSFEYNETTNTLTITNIILSTDQTLTAFTIGSVLFVDSNKKLAEDNANLFYNDSANEFYVGGTTSGTADVILAANGNVTIKGGLIHTGSTVGFYGETPASQQTGYTTFANLSTDRTCDADTVLVAELADIVGTLIEDLKATGIISA